MLSKQRASNEGLWWTFLLWTTISKWDDTRQHLAGGGKGGELINKRLAQSNFILYTILYHLSPRLSFLSRTCPPFVISFSPSSAHFSLLSATVGLPAHLVLGNTFGLIHPPAVGEALHGNKSYLAWEFSPPHTLFMDGLGTIYIYVKSSAVLSSNHLCWEPSTAQDQRLLHLLMDLLRHLLMGLLMDRPPVEKSHSADTIDSPRSKAPLILWICQPTINNKDWLRYGSAFNICEAGMMRDFLGILLYNFIHDGTQRLFLENSNPTIPQ